MKKAWIASLFALLLSLPAAAAVPKTLAFTARIADSGRPVTGSHTVKFTFWDCDGTNPATCVAPANVLWTETQTLVANDGVVTAALGADVANPLAPTIFNGGPLFLEITFDGTPFTPRMTIQSVPYAIRSGEVDSVLPNVVMGIPNPGTVTYSVTFTLALGANYLYPFATFTPPANGVCIVSAEVNLQAGAAATTTIGPYLRIAVQRSGANSDDGIWGMYSGPLALNGIANMSRTRSLPVTAGQATAFGCHLYAPSEWVGKTTTCIVDWTCFY